MNTVRQKKGFRAVIMWWGEYALRMQTEQVRAESAKEMWNDLDRSTAEELKDNTGPSHLPLRLPIHVEDYIVGESDLSHEKRVELECNRYNIGTSEDIEAARNRQLQGHAVLTDRMFDSVGGAFSQQLAHTGSSFAVDASGHASISQDNPAPNAAYGLGVNADIGLPPP